MLLSCHGRKALPNFICPTSFDTEKNYNISFWAKNDSNPTQRRIFENAVKSFNEFYPNIHITIKHFTSYPELYQTIITNIGTNTTPNVAITYPDHVATYLENPTTIIELEDIANDSRFGLGGSEVKFKSVGLNEFVSSYIKEGYLIQDGLEKLYTLPFMRSTEVMYVNKTWLLEHQFALPQNNIFTWDYVWEIARYARSIDEKMIPLVYQSSDNFFIELAYQNGYPYTNKQGDILFDNKQNKQMILDLNAKFKEHLYITKANTGDYPGDRLNNGTAIFGIDSSAGSTWIGPNSPLSETKGEDFEVLVTTVPQVDSSNPMTISQGPSLCVFNKSDAGEVLASWLFAQYLLTTDVQIAYAKTEGYSPVTMTAIYDDNFQAFLRGEETYYVQREAINNVIAFRDKSFITPAFNGSTKVRENVGRIIDKASLSYKKELDIEAIFKQAMIDSGLI